MKKATWDSAAFIAHIDREAMRRVTNCCVTAVAHAKEEMVRVPGVPAPEGEMPHRQTSTLAPRITYQVESNAAGIMGMWGIIPAEKGGEELAYARPLQTGFHDKNDDYHGPWPWLDLTKDAVWGKWRQLLGVR